MDECCSVQVPDGPSSQSRKNAAAAAAPAVAAQQSVASGLAYQRRLNTCKAELQQLVQQKRDQCSAERMAKQMMESAEWESRPPPPGNSSDAGSHLSVVITSWHLFHTT